MFEKKDFSKILDSMQTSLQQKSEGEYDFEEGSIVRSLFESFALEMAVLYEQMELVYLSGHIDTAQDSDLDKVVAVLGIKRGEPDFAIGEVTFERDLGIDEEITIPINTLVTTEDSEESPKKSYQTIELKTIPKGEAKITVRVQAEESGKKGETDAKTVIIMPQPVAGIKSVNNQEKITFQGRERETDTQLRNRAKESLLASGNANYTSIKNTLLSIHGVREVKIREHFTENNPQYGVIEVIIETADWFKFIDDAQETDEDKKKQIQENRKQVEAKIDEVKAAGIYVLLKQPELINLDATFLIEFSPNLKPTPEERVTLEKEIEEKIKQYIANLPMGQFLQIAKLTKLILDVNGVNDIQDYDMSTDFVNLSGKVTISLEESTQLSKPLTINLNTKLTTQIDNNNQELKTIEAGILNKEKRFVNIKFQTKQSIFKNLVKERLKSENVTSINWDDLKIDEYNLKVESYEPDKWTYSDIATSKAIILEEIQKLKPRKIQVASEIKPLYINIEVELSDIDENKEQKIKQKIESYFNSLKSPDTITKEDIKTIIKNLSSNSELNQEYNIKNEQIKLIPQSSKENNSSEDKTEINVSFVEKAILGNLFIYNKTVEINGALKLILPVTATTEDQGEIYKQARERIKNYLSNLPSKENKNVFITQLIAEVKFIKDVLNVEYQLSDFEGKIANNEIIRVDGEQIKVEKFTKCQLSEHFLISADAIPIEIRIVGLTLNIKLPKFDYYKGTKINQEEEQNLENEYETAKSNIEAKIRGDFFATLNPTQLSIFSVGESIDIESLKNTIKLKLLTSISNISLNSENSDALKFLLTYSDYEIVNIKLNRVEVTNNNQDDLTIRIIEQAVIQPIEKDDENLIIDLTENI